MLFIVSGGRDDNMLRVFPIDSENELYSRKIQSGIRFVDAKEDCIVVVGSSPNTVYVLDAELQDLQTFTTEGVPCKVTFSDDGDRFAVGFSTGMVEIYSLTSSHWEVTHKCQVHSTWLNSIVWLNADVMATSSDDKTIKMWNWQSGAVICQIQNAEGPRCTRLTTSQTNPRVLFSGHMGGKVRKWMLSESMMSSTTATTTVTPKPELTELSCHGSGAVRGLRLSDDGTTLYTSADDRQVMAWDVETLTNKWIFTCADEVDSLVVAPDAIVVGVKDNAVLVLDIDRGQPLRQLAKHRGHVFALAVPRSSGFLNRFQFVD